MAAPIILTARDVALLEMLAGGYDTHEIAIEMLLTPATVKTYIRDLLVTLDAKNRAHAVALGYHHGLLTPARRAA